MNPKNQQYVEDHKARFLNELIDLLKFPSNSAKSENKEDCRKCAEKVAEHFKSLTFHTTIYPTPGHPIVYAEKIISKSAPTILVYGHYDVQPPDPLHFWHSDPFSPIIKDGNIYARGAADDKGQFFTHIKAAEVLLKNNELQCNLKFVIEGEEEIGSSHLEDFVSQNKNMLETNIVVISDTAMLALDKPSIDISTRGLCFIEIEATASNRDLHSGVYGGGVANPLLMLAKIIANLHDNNNKITIPHFYDDVEEISQQEKDYFTQIGYNEQTLCTDLGIKQSWGEQGYSYLERTSTRPTLEINGMWGGYIEEGAKTVLPAKAFAKISCRLVPNQNYKKINALLKNYFETLNNPFVTLKVNILHGGNPYITHIDTKEFSIASEAFEKVFGKKPIPTRGGGTIPITSLFESTLGVKVLFLGYGLNSDNLHSPNEKFGIENFYKGIQTNIEFYNLFAEKC